MSRLGSWFRRTLSRNEEESVLAPSSREPIEVSSAIAPTEDLSVVAMSTPILPASAGGGIVATDPKKVATMIGICANQIEIIRPAMLRIEEVKAAFLLADPDVTGTPLEGNVATVNQAIEALKAEVDKAIWTQLIAARVPSHRNEALEV